MYRSDVGPGAHVTRGPAEPIVVDVLPAARPSPLPVPPQPPPELPSPLDFVAMSLGIMMLPFAVTVLVMMTPVRWWFGAPDRN